VVVVLDLVVAVPYLVDGGGIAVAADGGEAEERVGKVTGLVVEMCLPPIHIAVVRVEMMCHVNFLLAIEFHCVYSWLKISPKHL
jgi:hypothetical protein